MKQIVLGALAGAAMMALASADVAAEPIKTGAVLPFSGGVGVRRSPRAGAPPARSPAADTGEKGLAFMS